MKRKIPTDPVHSAAHRYQRVFSTWRCFITPKWLLYPLLSLFVFLNPGLAAAQTPGYFYTFTGGSNSWPLNATPVSGNNKCQWLYAPGDFNIAPPASGLITAVYFRPTNSVTFNFTNLEVRMANTALTALVNGPWNATTSYYLANTTISTTANGWIKIVLQTPFSYTGGNFIAELSQQSASPSGIIINQGTLATNRRMYGSTSNATSSGADITLAAFGFDLAPLSTGTITGAPFCPGSTISIPFFNSQTVNSGNIYTAQLSDASGSFAAPVPIGSLVSTGTSGTIAGIIPLGTASGTGYRIRVISSNIAAIGGDNGVDFLINPARIYVDGTVASSGSGGSWASPLKTVTEALAAANRLSCSPPEIWVAKGTYYPTTNTNRDSSFRILRNGIKIYGGFNSGDATLAARNVTANPTILSGDIGVVNDSTDNAYHVMTIVATPTLNIDTNTRVDGFTIRAGNAQGSGNFTVNAQAIDRSYAGGLYIGAIGAGNSCSPFTNNCTITGNAATYGGGIFINSRSGGTSAPYFTNTGISANISAVQGGGMYATSDAAGGSASPVFRNCTISGNTTSANGAGLLCSVPLPATGNVTLYGCTLDNNIQTSASASSGSALFFSGNVNASITGSSFTNNRAANYGGAVEGYGMQNLAIDSSSFTSNTAGATGGALDITGAYTTITNSTFTANKSGSGGAVEMENYGSLAITNCNFISDTATAYGGAVRNAVSTGVTISNSRFLNNYGAGGGAALDNTGNSPLVVNRSVFSGNKGVNLGGVINNNNGTATFNNCVLESNSSTGAAGNGGAAHVNAGSTITFNNCTLSNNTAASTTQPNSNAVGIDAGATASFNNTIVWGSAAQQIANSGTANYSYSDVKGITPPATSVNTNPLFLNAGNAVGVDGTWGTADDGLRLFITSGAINSGSNVLAPAGTDVAGGVRIQGTTVDMGAYESPFTCGSGIVYVDSSKAVSGDGATWATAFKTLTEGLTIAQRCPLVTQVWVAKGTYYSMEGDVVTTNRDSSFRILRNGIRLYGGFASGGSAFASRNITANPTILSGDIGVQNDSTDNVYHVLTIVASAGSSMDTNTVVDGFTVTKGNATGASTLLLNGINIIRNDGGGIGLVATAAGFTVSPLIENCTITRNSAGVGGGIYCGGYTGGISSPVVRNCLFIQNTAGGVGGLHSRAGGGGLANPIVTNCQFIANTATIGGAMGAFSDGGGSANPVVFNCIFSANTATDRGGAVNIYAGSFTATNSVFVNNITNGTSSNGGGAIFIPGGNTATLNNTTLYNNTLNVTGVNSSAIVAGGTLNLNNTLVWGAATTQITATGTVNYTNSDARDATVTAPNLNVDPLFFNPANPIGTDGIWSTADDGLRLKPCSPAVNAGLNSAAAGIAADITGAARIQQTTVDMGAYENNLTAIALGTTPQIDVLCKGAATGSATINITGGQAPYTYTWTGTVSATGTASNLTAGTYTATVTDGTGCQVTKIFTITEPATAITSSVVSQTAVSCFGNATATATVTASGGTGTLSYSWNSAPVQTGPTATNLAAGSYTVTITDANNCTKTQSVVITGPSSGLTASASKVNVTCFGAANGTATAIPAGGTGSYTYSWNTIPVQNTQMATGLAPGTYTVTVRDANLCTATASVTITGPAAAITLISTQTNVLCFGNNTGSASVAPAGGTLPYTYTWTGSASTSATASGLIAGTYVVTVKDANLCQTTQSFTITQPAAALASTIASQTNVNCFGQTTGSATVTASGGTAPYTYAWSPSGGSNATATNLAAGSYTLTITDANLCTKTQSVTITQPLGQLTVSTSSNSPQCSGSAVNVTAIPAGGTLPYTFSWAGPGAFNAITQNLAFNPVTNANAGTYTLILTDFKGCTATANTTIVVNNVPAQPVAINGNTAVCGGISNIYSVAPVPTATSYSWTLPSTPAGWSGSSATASISATAPNAPGTGAISVTALNGCGASPAQTLNVSVITIPATPGVIVGTTTVCGGISQLYSITPVAQATSYTWAVPSGWSAPSPSATNYFINSTPPTTIGAGNGNIIVSASNSCGTSGTFTLPVTVTNIPALPGVITGGTSVCAGTTQLYKIPKSVGATAYTWDATGNGWTTAAGSAADTFLNTVAGTAGITVSVTASNFCGVSPVRTLAITVTNKPGQAGAILGLDTVCTGAGSVTYTTGIINEATSYTWTLPAGWAGSSTTGSITGTPGATAATGTPVSVAVAGVNTCGTGPATAKTILLYNTVTPSVSLSAFPIGAVCTGGAVTWTAVGTNGGAGATYQWRINNVNVGTAGSSNTFTPAAINNGDIVSVVMRSSMPCPTTTNGLAGATAPAIVVNPIIVPGININATAPPNLCRGVPVTFYSNIVAAGSTPGYQWYRNGVTVGGATGATYTVNNLNNNDTIRAILVSNAQCRLVDTVSSNKMGVQVSNFMVPEVTISANPGTAIAAGQVVIFTATVTNAGTNPEVRWKRNGQVISNTSGLSWSTTTLRDGDVISADLVSGAQCATPFLVSSTNRLTMRVSTGVIIPGSSVGSVTLYPNPTTGKFTLMVTGTNGKGRQMRIQILNAVGQSVYESAAIPDTRDWSMDVRLEDNLANGTYLLRVGLAEGDLNPAIIRFSLKR